MIPCMHEYFQPKQILPSRDIKFPAALQFCILSVTKGHFLENLISQEQSICFDGKFCCMLWVQIVLSCDTSLVSNLVFSIIPKLFYITFISSVE